MNITQLFEAQALVSKHTAVIDRYWFYKNNEMDYIADKNMAWANDIRKQISALGVDAETDDSFYIKGAKRPTDYWEYLTRKGVILSRFILVSNWNDEVIMTIENADMQEILAGAELDWAMGDQKCNWYTMYEVGKKETHAVAVFDDGEWYQPNGYTELNW